MKIGHVQITKFVNMLSSEQMMSLGVSNHLPAPSLSLQMAWFIKNEMSDRSWKPTTKNVLKVTQRAVLASSLMPIFLQNLFLYEFFAKECKSL